MGVENGDNVVVESKRYNELLESQNVNCKKNNRRWRVQELCNDLKKWSKYGDDLYVFTKKKVVERAIKLFDCCPKTGYNYFSELQAKGKIVEAPLNKKVEYNQKYRRKKQREINVYCLKEDLYDNTCKKNSFSYSQTEKTQIKREDVDIMKKYIDATPLKQRTKAEVVS
ncbi:MAG TPA: hypothetical protein ENI51_10775 [Candidatus Atribacteria bacterium]|nr:hypothetical protein [Candidatus Atribacteria bacterium]